MKIKSQAELSELDERINLFNEDDWDFFEIRELEDNNYEYFDDVRDLDFIKATKPDWVSTLVPIVGIICLLATVVLVSCSVLGVWEKPSTNIVAQSTEMSRVEGNECGNEAVVECSKTLSTYFGVLQSKSGYETLSTLCQNGSVFERNYTSLCDNIEASYDIYDGKARMLKELGSSCSVGKINEVIEKDGLYYCYVTLSMPTSYDMYEYIYLYQYNLTKYFASNEVTEANVLKFLAETYQANKVPSTSAEYCLIFDSEYKLVDDTQIYNICDSAGVSGVSQCSQMIGANRRQQ